jgi:hypothetical protein
MAKADLIANMAQHLRNHETDLGDERAVFRTLSALHFLHGDIVAYADEAVELARRGGPNLKSIFGDSVALILAVGAWLAWYCILCPAANAAQSAMPDQPGVMSFIAGVFIGIVVGGAIIGIFMAAFCMAKNADLQDENDRLRASEYAQ